MPRRTQRGRRPVAFLGLDVGKDNHHAVGLDPDGTRLHDAPLPSSEPKPRALFDKLGQNGPLLVVVDQPATIGALPVAVARGAGHQAAELEVLVGFDDDLAGEATRIADRIRGLLTGTHPALQRAIGPNISHPPPPAAA